MLDADGSAGITRSRHAPESCPARTRSTSPEQDEFTANTKNQVGTELADQVVYVNTRLDAVGAPLDGCHDYVLHFEPGQIPPVAGMRNLAMYDEAMFFIPNKIDRFTIGSTTDGVTPSADGSLTIYIQHAQPGDGRAANWLPAPEGRFNLTMRFYAPLSPVLDKTYALTPVQPAG